MTFLDRLTIAFILNFVLFVVIAFIVGGDAANARLNCPSGAYLWDSTRAIPCHRVSQRVYVYSLVHSYITMGSGLALFVMAVSQMRARSR